MTYDARTEVVRVYLEPRHEDTVAVPLSDFVMLVTPELDRVVGMDILDLPSFAARYISDDLVSTSELHGEALFEATKRHLWPLVDFFASNFGTRAKDLVASWDEFDPRA